MLVASAPVVLRAVPVSVRSRNVRAACEWLACGRRGVRVWCLVGGGCVLVRVDVARCVLLAAARHKVRVLLLGVAFLLGQVRVLPVSARSL